MAIDLRFAKKGKDEPRDGVVQQGRFHAALAEKHAAPLAECGWPSPRTANLKALIGTLESRTSIQADARGAARGAAGAESAAVLTAKAFLRRLRYALPEVLRESPVAGVSAESFAAGGKLGYSAPRIVGYLNKIAGAVELLDEPLRPFFKNQKASELLRGVRDALSDADAAQELTLAGVPEETLKVYEAKGRLVEAIEDLNRIAAIAFDGDAELRGQFNKDILSRARKARKKAA
jgi:hypothetical protein